MSRIRTIKPDFWRNEDLSLVSSEAALLAIGLLNFADDEGFFQANPRLIQADIFPLRELSRTPTVLLEELSKIGFVRLFSGVDGKPYGEVVNFRKHQVINKPSASKFKGLEQFTEGYGSSTVSLLSGKEGKGKEMEGEETAPAVPSVASIHQLSPESKKDSKRKGNKLPDDFAFPDDWISEAATEMRCSSKEVDSDRLAFLHYYTNGKGKNEAHVDWRMTWRNWYRKPYSFCSKAAHPQQASATPKNYFN